MRRAMLLGLALHAGCSAAPEPEAVHEHPADTLGLSGDPAIDGPLEVWRDRWQAASGILVHFEDGGAPVQWAAAMNDPRDCAETLIASFGSDEWVQEMRIASDPVVGCTELQYVVGHELGHVISVGRAQHSATGIFRKHLDVGTAPRIDEASLSAVCSVSPCTVFDPE